MAGGELFWLCINCVFCNSVTAGYEVFCYRGSLSRKYVSTLNLNMSAFSAFRLFDKLFNISEMKINEKPGL